MSNSGSDSVSVAAESEGGSAATLFSSSLMIAAIAFFLAVVVFVALLDLYARLRWGPDSRRGRIRRSRLVFRDGNGDHASAPRRGLAAEVLKALPVRIYRASEFDEAVECAVCLSELAEGDKLRMLPRCHHGFHVDCIDMWFHSHSTCPLCRNPVGASDLPVPAQPSLPAATATSSEAASAPATDGGVLVIEIPSRAVDVFTSSASSPLSSTRRANGCDTTAATPSRLRPLRRMMSREKRAAVPSSCSSPHGDLEKGMAVAGRGSGAGGLRTPRKRGD